MTTPATYSLATKSEQEILADLQTLSGKITAYSTSPSPTIICSDILSPVEEILIKKYLANGDATQLVMV